MFLSSKNYLWTDREENFIGETTEGYSKLESLLEDRLTAETSDGFSSDFATVGSFISTQHPVVIIRKMQVQNTGTFPLNNVIYNYPFIEVETSEEGRNDLKVVTVELLEEMGWR